MPPPKKSNSPQSQGEPAPANKPIRLQRFLAQSGLGSRRHCEQYIEEGRVSVDGKQVTQLGTTVTPQTQEIRVDGERIKTERKQYYMLNKPCGYLCTHNDPQGRARAIDLLPQNGARLFTVGRLDENSQGLLLATNDGELANRLAHPRFQVERRYQVQVAGRPTRDEIYQLKQGLKFADGRFRVRGIKRLKTQGKSSFLEITLTEGQNREIRRLFARIEHKVMKLKRVGFGPLHLGRLAEGQTRPLKDTELKALWELVRQQTETDKRPAKKNTRPPSRKRSR
jgi:23S rRNA pseudouridine2605 synthase